jgi:hypothetical protein
LWHVWLGTQQSTPVFSSYTTHLCWKKYVGQHWKQWTSALLLSAVRSITVSTGTSAWDRRTKQFMSSNNSICRLRLLGKYGLRYKPTVVDFCQSIIQSLQSSEKKVLPQLVHL